MPPNKYSFIASLESLKVDGPLGSGWNIAADLKISTSTTIAKSLVNESLSYSIGEIEATDILSGKPFLFATSDYPLEDLSPGAQKRLLNAHLKIALSFCNVLWLIKDNSVSFDRGFLQYPYEKSKTPQISANNWTTRYSKADGQFGVTEFSKEEMRTAISMYNSLYGATPSSDVSPHLTPGTAGAVDRLSRALYFLQGARSMEDFPEKVTSYCTSFEALVSTNSTELAHQVSERVAVLIGEDPSEALEIYRNLKKAYGTRSKLVHGDQLTAEKDQYLTQSLNCDKYLRRLLHVVMTNDGVGKAIAQNPEKVDQFFLGKLFGT